MKYRKSHSGREIVRVDDDMNVLSIMFLTSGSVRVHYSKSAAMSHEAEHKSLFSDCTQQEFKQAYTRAMKMIEI